LKKIYTEIREEVKRYSQKKSTTILSVMLFFENLGWGQKSTSAAFGQNRQHIGHHCGCNDKQLDRNLLHDITSFFMDL